MARFKCDECGFDGHREWLGKKQCPACGEVFKCRVAIRFDEISESEDDPISRELVALWQGALGDDLQLERDQTPSDADILNR